MNIIGYLKAIGYDYLPLCYCDGVTDDSRIIQARLDAGLDPFKRRGISEQYLLKNTIVKKSNNLC